MSAVFNEQSSTNQVFAEQPFSEAVTPPAGSMIGGGGAGPSRQKIEKFLKSLESKERKRPRKKKAKPPAVVALAPFDLQQLTIPDEPIAPPTDIEMLLAASAPVQMSPMLSATAAVEQMLMQHRLRQQEQAEEERIIEFLLLI